MSPGDLERVAQIAREAGRLIMSTYALDFSVDYKGPGDPVTDADREANALICAELGRAFPDAAIVAEESDPATYADYREQERVFFVDPLDGTREFVAKNGQFVVMIGLVVGAASELGVVYAPTTDTLWCGLRGAGAHRIDADGSKVPIHVGEVSEPEAATVTVSRSRRSERLKRALQLISPRQVVPLGSAGLKGAQVAQASADVYLAVGTAGKLWDACALDALVSAAGGRVTDLAGQFVDYRGPQLELAQGILACNQTLHATLAPRLAQS